MAGSRSRAVAAVILLVAVAGCGSTSTSSDGILPSPATGSLPATTGAVTVGSVAVVLADVPFMRGDTNRSAIEPGPGPISQPAVAWDVPLDAVATLNPILVDGAVITGTADEIVALDGLTGATRWQRSIQGRLEGGLSSALGVLVGATAERVYGLDVATGEERWHVDLETAMQRPDIVDGIAYLGSTDGKVVGVDVRDGTADWTWQGPHGLTMRVDLVANGVVYVASNDGRLFTISVSDRSEGWTFQAQAVRVSPSKAGDTIFVASGLEEMPDRSGQVVALDSGTGAARWRFSPPSGEQAVHGPVRDGLVFVTTRGDGMYAVRDRGMSEEVAWHADIPTTDWPAILAGDTLYVATRDEGVWAVRASDGQPLFHTPPGSSIRGPIVSGGLLFAVLGEPAHVIAWAEPTVVAQLPHVSPSAASASPASPASDPPASPASDPPNPLTVVRTYDASITGVHVGDRANGPEGTQMDIGPDGLLYVIDNDAIVSVINPSTGTSVRSWGGLGHSDGRFDGKHDIAVGPDGRVYAADAGNHRIQVFDQTGAFIRQIGSFGSGLGQFSQPTNVDVGRDGSLYVGDGGTITRFGPDGNVAWRVGGAGDANVQLQRDTYDFAVLPDGHVLAAFAPGGPELLLDPADGKPTGPWGPDDIGASGEPAVAPDGNIWMFQYAPGRFDVFTADGTRLGAVLFDTRDEAFPKLYPTPVLSPNGHAYSFDRDLGLVEMSVNLPKH
jgi:outer membrane protein assembly factor BamB